MRYVSIDLETTGIDPLRDQILMVAMIVEDTDKPRVPVDELPTFACLVRHERYVGDPVALAMNARLLEKLGNEHENEWVWPGMSDVVPVFNGYVKDEPAWVHAAATFLTKHLGFLPRGEIIAAGKNVGGFDLPFIKTVSPWLKAFFKHRVIDPGSLFLDWSDPSPPSLVVLKKRFGIDTPSAHDAVGDARDVIRVLRAGSNDYASNKTNR